MKPDKATQAQSIEHLSDPDRWINWPVQTVKRYGDKGLQCGLVFDGELTTVVEANLFALDGMTEEQRNAAPHYRYDSIVTMIKDGWEVD